MRLNVGVGLDVLLKEQAVALFDAIAFPNENIGDPAEALGLDVCVRRGFYFARGSDQGDESVLLSDLGRLHGGDALIRLIHTVKNNTRSDHHDSGTDRHFLPHLHDRCFLFMSQATTSPATVGGCAAEDTQ